MRPDPSIWKFQLGGSDLSSGELAGKLSEAASVSWADIGVLFETVSFKITKVRLQSEVICVPSKDQT